MGRYLDPQTYPLLFFLPGDCKELHYQLMTFGIPTQLLPINNAGDYNLEHVHLFWKSRSALERSQLVTPTTHSSISNCIDQSYVTVVPGPLDVLLGRDKVAQNHTGNIRYLHLIESYMDQYEAAQRRDKKKIAIAVSDVVTNTGGRFLEFNGNVWFEVDNAIVIEKASTAFRSRRKIYKRSQQSDEPKTKRKEDPSWACCNESVSTSSSGGASIIRESEPLHMKRSKMDDIAGSKATDIGTFLYPDLKEESFFPSGS
jgi:hypothetical protein